MGYPGIGALSVGRWALTTGALLGLVGVLLLAGCGGGGGGGGSNPPPSSDPLVGTWTGPATNSFDAQGVTESVNITIGEAVAGKHGFAGARDQTLTTGSVNTFVISGNIASDNSVTTVMTVPGQTPKQLQGTGSLSIDAVTGHLKGHLDYVDNGATVTSLVVDLTKS